MTRIRAHRCASLRPGGRSCWHRVARRGERCPRCWADLAASPTTTDRIELAAEPGLPGWTAELLAADPEPMVRVLVAERSDTSPGLLGRLALDREAAVRARVAANPRAPTETTALLLGDAEGAVVLRLAGRPDLPADLLTGLVGHRDPRVRATVAVHPALDAGGQRRLACAEADARVLASLAERPDLDPVVRSWLLRHPAAAVSRAATGRLRSGSP